MTNLSVNAINNITYTNSKQEHSDKDVILCSGPVKNVMTLDVTELPEEKREELLSMWNEYCTYRSNHNKQLFKFEQFIEQQFPESTLEDPLKWRSLTISGIVERDTDE